LSGVCHCPARCGRIREPPGEGSGRSIAAAGLENLPLRNEV
jgi:hypothetical protein